MDAAGWGADVIYSGTQKCLSAPPGLSPFAVSPAAREAIAARKTKARTWLFDMGLLMGYWGGEGGRTYHHTAPINALYGLHEALVVLQEEGLAAAHARHRAHPRGPGGRGRGGGPDVPGRRRPTACRSSTPCACPTGSTRRRARPHAGQVHLEIGAGLGPLRARSGASA